jgi:hypothetical protein
LSARDERKLPDAATVLSLVLYAALCALILVTLCAGLGWLDRPAPSFDQLPAPAYMRNSTLGFYDKSELRLALFAMLSLSVALAFLFIRLAARRKPVACLHPAHAAFAIVLYFTTVVPPPYEVDLDHWFPLVSAATAIRNGVWPYFSGYDSGYGLLAPAVLVIWLAGFGLSTLSLSALISASTAVAGGASFTLMRRLTGSRSVALLGTSYLLLEATGPTAVISTFRAPVQIALGALLLYASLRGDARGTLAGFLFGLVALWNPPFGAFAVAGFTCAHACSVWQSGVLPRHAAARPLLAMFAGLILPVAIIGTTITGAGLNDGLGALAAGGGLVMLGYGNLGQQFDLIILPGFLLLVLYAGLLYRRQARGLRLTRRTLFAGASLISAAPWVLYATGRSDATHYYAAWWALLPCIVMLAWGFIRLLALRPLPQRGRLPTRLSLTLLCVLFIVLFPSYRFNELLAGYITSYESAREAWYSACVARKSCDARHKPSLANYLREASEPLAAGRLAHDRGLGEACRRNIAILSYGDAWIYTTGNCYTPTGMPTVNLINTNAELERYVALLAAQPLVLVDPGLNIYSQWRGDMLGEIKKRLLAMGFAETPGCGHFTVLSRGKPDAALAQLCD